ncbi:MAG: hypothetical protein V4695_06140 [Pseudomonadota bacterium]
MAADIEREMQADEWSDALINDGAHDSTKDQQIGLTINVTNDVQCINRVPAA